MKKAHPIKTDLFRFITLRTPQHISNDKKDKFFIFFENENIRASYFKDLLLSEKIDEKGLYNLINNFNPKKTHSGIREIDPKIYDFSSQFFQNRGTLKDIDKEFGMEEQIDSKQLLRLIDELFYQVITKESDSIRQACCQMIITDNIVERYNKQRDIDIDSLSRAKIVIPSTLIEYIKIYSFPNCDGIIRGVNNLGIADFRKVEQEVCCYVPGEVSYIENILAREYKERSTRNFMRSEYTTETTSETEIENLSDVTTATRNELSTEISSVINEDQSTNYGGSLGVEASYMGAKISTNAYADFANSNSISQSNSNAKLYAEEVTRRALEKIVQKTSKKRSSKIIKEFEDNNKHGFDNREGDKHVTGIYRWLDIIYKNRLVNYGKRLMLEFSVPEPAEFYKRTQNYKKSSNDSESQTTTPPQSLESLGINSPTDISRDNYIHLSNTYNVFINAPLEDKLKISETFNEASLNKRDKTINFEISIPTGYQAEKVSGELSLRYGGDRWYGVVEMRIGDIDRKYSFPPSRTNKNERIRFAGIEFNTNYRDKIAVSIYFKSLFWCNGTFTVDIKLQPERFREWQNRTYNQLYQAFNTLSAQYEEKQKQENNEEEFFEEDQKSSNPAYNRITEQRELKRACIELITKPFCRNQGRRLFDDIDPCEDRNLLIPSIRQDADFNDYVTQVKFFEQAFDWNLMSYLFYPYYWADKCDWVDLIKSEDDDLIFQAFKQAGMARVVVPVRPEFNEAITYYLETGDIWLGGDLVADTEDDLFLSIANELETVEGAVEEEWETRVPTSLAIVQGGSAYLEDEGLPCCKEYENVNIQPADNILARENTE